MTIARDEELALLFGEARTHSAWIDRPIDDALLHRVYDLARMGPTGGNGQPLRVEFVRSQEAKEKLRPSLMAQNVDKAMTAPITAVLAYDLEFYEKLPKLFPMRPEMRENIGSRPAEVRRALAEQSATLQAGYLVLAARALGLDCGPMGGFDRAKVDEAFFAGTSWRTFLLVNLGYGDPTKLYPRLPRLDFDEACRVA